MLLPEERIALLKAAIQLIVALRQTSPWVLVLALLTFTWRMLPESDKRALLLAATALGVLYLTFR